MGYVGGAGAFSGVVNWSKPTGNWNDPDVKNHVKADADMGSDYGQTSMSPPAVTTNDDGSLTVRSELNWWVRENYKLTAVSLAEIKDHVKGWRNWQDSDTGDGYEAVQRFKATAKSMGLAKEEAAARLKKTLDVKHSDQHYRQKSEFDYSGKHSLRRHPELGKPIEAKDIENAIKSLPYN